MSRLRALPLLCRLGLHSWRYAPERGSCYSNVWTCRHCPAEKHELCIG